jgi:hypothetical protein
VLPTKHLLACVVICRKTRTLQLQAALQPQLVLLMNTIFRRKKIVLHPRSSLNLFMRGC